MKKFPERFIKKRSLYFSIKLKKFIQLGGV
jgi:hypothetical protein